VHGAQAGAASLVPCLLTASFQSTKPTRPRARPTDPQVVLAPALPPTLSSASKRRSLDSPPRSLFDPDL
jgi:hypothetical protein